MNLSIPRKALRAIDKLADAAGKSRSMYMVESSLRRVRGDAVKGELRVRRGDASVTNSRVSPAVAGKGKRVGKA